MACPFHRQVDPKDHASGRNGYCDAEELWRLRVPTPLEENRYCNTEDYIECPVLNSSGK
jgi:hypothetical protein